jgi:hypothetical protein
VSHLGKLRIILRPLLPIHPELEEGGGEGGSTRQAIEATGLRKQFNDRQEGLEEREGRDHHGHALLVGETPDSAARAL